jgi:hypothetical protein
MAVDGNLNRGAAGRQKRREELRQSVSRRIHSFFEGRLHKKKEKEAAALFYTQRRRQWPRTETGHCQLQTLGESGEIQKKRDQI